MLMHMPLPAGLGLSTVVPDLDFETYSEAGFVWDDAEQKWKAPPDTPPQQGKGLSVVGAANYSAHPTCEILSLYYDLKDGHGRRFWRPGLPPPADLHAHVVVGGLLEAWNVAFERWIWENVCVARLGWPPMHPRQWRCAMGKARSFALPGKLEKAGEVLNLATQKDKRGKSLLDRFSVPRNPTQADPRRRARPIWTQEDMDREATQFPAMNAAARKILTADASDTAALAQYNEVDIITEAEASARTPDLSPLELEHWFDDQEINHRGIGIDTFTLGAAISIVKQALTKYDAEFEALTGIDGTSKLQQLQGWLKGRGVHMASLDADSIEAALKEPGGLDAGARRALELRAAVGSASVKKVFSMRNELAPDGRLHDLYTWHGARTGRPTGNGPQPTNLPKAGPAVLRCTCGHHHAPARAACPWCGMPVPPGAKPVEWNPKAAEDAIYCIASHSLEFVEHVMGNAMESVAGSLRGLFVPKDGHDFISSDFTAIEGVVIAALAGEQWRLDVYRNNGQIYIESASRAFNVPLQEFLDYKAKTGQHHPLRDKGKRMELGLGFGGWIGALRSPQIDMKGTDDELKDMILKWRGASPAIVELWGGQRKNWQSCMFGLEGAAVSAVLQPGTWFPVTRLDGTDTGISYICADDILYCKLLSGRFITYHRPRLQQPTETWRGLGLSFEGWNSNQQTGPVGWQRMNTYSGKLAENVVQATARDIQMNAIRNCERDGAYPIVMHTYDELVAEVPKGRGSVEGLEARMTDVPPWARGWPIKAAGGWRDGRYQKA
jgi:DNA polymerase bacteriophage-type